MNDRNKEDFSPSPHEFLVSNKSLGYKLTEALADLVDNSISAEATKIFVEIKDHEDSFFSVVIADNGHGMTVDELRQSFRPSVNSTKMDRSKNDLGRFGMGMKTASLSLSNELHVFSKKEGNTNGRLLDVNRIKDHGKWELEIIDLDDFGELNKVSETIRASGTIIYLKNCRSNDYSVAADVAKQVKNYFSVIYHRFLKDGLEIQVNNIEVKSVPVIPKSAQFKDGNPFKDSNWDYKIWLLPPESRIHEKDDEVNLQRFNSYFLESNMLDQQGLYFYRSNRLVSIKSDWYGIVPKKQKYRLARVEVDIPSTDDSIWGVNVMKNKVSIPKRHKDHIKNVIKTAYSKSKERISGEERIRITEGWQKDSENPWYFIQENAMTYPKINKDHPVIQSFFSDWSDNRIEALSSFLVQSFPVNELSELHESTEGVVAGDNIGKIERLFESLLVELQASMSRKDASDLLMRMEPFKTKIQND
jgi:anti-sigma regulatory factor (Ser/Thr protein kinase)